MQTFKDTEGRDWLVAINAGIATRLKKVLKIDLMDQVGVGLLAQIVRDPIQLADVLFVVCHEQATTRQLDEVAFGSALSGDALESASVALREAVTDFFPTSRPVIAKALRKMRETESRISAKAIAMLETDNPERMIEKQFPKTGDALTQTINKMDRSQLEGSGQSSTTPPES